MAATGFEWDGSEVSVGRVAEHLRAERFLVRRLDGGRAFMVQAPPMSGVRSGWWMLWDNGGELGVELVNVRAPRFVPTTFHSAAVGPLTLLSRVLAVLRDEPVDWSENLDRD